MTPRARSATNTGWFKHEVVNAVHLCLRLPLRIPMSGHCRPPSGRSGESALACCGMIDVCMWAAVISSAGLRGEWLVGAREPAVPLVSCLAEIGPRRLTAVPN